MIDVTSSPLYREALSELERWKNDGGNYRGHFVQIFLAFKFYETDLPSVTSDQAISTGRLQELIDDLYAKSSRPDDDCVLMLFENDYNARTGVVAPGNEYPTNTWRNNFNLQKGIGCYATADELTDPAFLDQPRTQCPHLLEEDADEDGGLAGCTCELAAGSPRYRGDEHRKWLQINDDGGYATVDLSRVPTFREYVVPEGREGIPLAPLVVALYHDASDGLVTGTRDAVDTSQFAADFNLSAQELQSYFDDDPETAHNNAIAEHADGGPWTPIQDLPGSTPREEPGEAEAEAGREERDGVPEPNLDGTRADPPQINTGFEPERYVADVFEDAGWDVEDVSHQRVGYDLHVSRHMAGTRYVEVKSSVGACSPTLTAREWRQAQRHREDYVLAILEDFDPQGDNEIHWIPDPASRCRATESQTITYSVPRTSWSGEVATFDDITD